MTFRCSPGSLYSHSCLSTISVSLALLTTLREAQFLFWHIFMESFMHGMLMEVNGLDIMLIIVAMVELTGHGMSCMVEGRSLQMVRLWRPSVLRLNRVMLAQ